MELPVKRSNLLNNWGRSTIPCPLKSIKKNLSCFIPTIFSGMVEYLFMSNYTPGN